MAKNEADLPLNNLKTREKASVQVSTSLIDCQLCFCLVRLCPIIQHFIYQSPFSFSCLRPLSLKKTARFFSELFSVDWQSLPETVSCSCCCVGWWVESIERSFMGINSVPSSHLPSLLVLPHQWRILFAPCFWAFVDCLLLGLISCLSSFIPFYSFCPFRRVFRFLYISLYLPFGSREIWELTKRIESKRTSVLSFRPLLLLLHAELNLILSSSWFLYLGFFYSIIVLLDLISERRWRIFPFLSVLWFWSCWEANTVDFWILDSRENSTLYVLVIVILDSLRRFAFKIDLVGLISFDLGWVYRREVKSYHGIGVSLPCGWGSDGGKAGDGGVLWDGDDWNGDTGDWRVDGVWYTDLEEENSCGNYWKWWNETAEICGNSLFFGYRCLFGSNWESRGSGQGNEGPSFGGRCSQPVIVEAGWSCNKVSPFTLDFALLVPNFIC